MQCFKGGCVSFCSHRLCIGGKLELCMPRAVLIEGTSGCKEHQPALSSLTQCLLLAQDVICCLCSHQSEARAARWASGKSRCSAGYLWCGRYNRVPVCRGSACFLLCDCSTAFERIQNDVAMALWSAAKRRVCRALMRMQAQCWTPIVRAGVECPLSRSCRSPFGVPL